MQQQLPPSAPRQSSDEPNKVPNTPPLRGNKRKVRGVFCALLALAVLAVGLLATLLVVGVTDVVKGIRSSGHADMQQSEAPCSMEASYSNNVLTVGGEAYEMVRVAGGSFAMGATPEMEGSWAWEKPTHQVTLTKDYYIGRTEVTQDLWQAVMGSNPSYYKGSNRPVESVSWDECQEFVRRLNQLTGEHFRLPTEAEWEYAARGGSRSRHYQYSGSADPDEVAWYDGNSGGQTYEVATKQPNELGIYDMSGNVKEWCADWLGNYSCVAKANPTGPDSGYCRVYRGGSWIGNVWCCRPSNRDCYAPDGCFSDVGLRLALSE